VSDALHAHPRQETDARPFGPALVHAALLLCGCASIPTPGPFYGAAETLPQGKPGAVLRSERMTGAPAGSTAYRVLYLSTGLDGTLVPVSGVVVVPPVSPPEGGRKVVAWAHPTTGVARGCAPSLLGRDVFETIPGLEDALSLGYVVTATDYPGLGTPGVHPYLVGLSEGRAVLDSVRAARALAEARAGAEFGIFGHSQGGQAALFAGELAAEYAPELTLVGVAAAAPATDLAVLFEAARGSDFGDVITAYSLWSWSRVYQAPVSSVLRPDKLPAVEKIAAGCAENVGQALRLLADLQSLRPDFLLADPTKVEPWSTLIARNRTGQAPAGAPLLVAQGTADTLVLPAVTRSFVSRLCRRGERVRYLELPDVDHIECGQKSGTAAVTWMLARFEGAPAPSSCPLSGP